MKKALSLLASLGLVATAGMTVVSCTKQDTTPTFKDWTSLKGMNLNRTNEIIPFETLSNTGKTTQLVLGSAANRFRNPEKVFQSLDNVTLSVDITNPLNKNYATPDESGENWSTASFNVVATVTNKDSSSTFNMTIKASKTKKLVDQLPVDKKLNGPQSDAIINKLRVLGKEAINNFADKGYKEGFVDIKTRDSEMAFLDQQIMSFVAEDCLPGLKMKDGKAIGRYVSAEQQIKDGMSYNDLKGNDVFVEFNKQILNEMSADIVANKLEGTDGIMSEATANDIFNNAMKVLKSSITMTLSLSTDKGDK